MNPYYPKKAKIVCSMSNELSDLKSIVSQAAQKRKKTSIDCPVDSDSMDPYEIRLKKSKHSKESKEQSTASFSHVHNIKGLSEVIESRKKSPGTQSSSASLSSDKKAKNKNKKDKNDKKGSDKNKQSTLTVAEEKTLARSREMLAKKAKIYEAMSRGSLVFDTEGESIMVNFQRKVANNDYYANEREDEHDEEEGKDKDKEAKDKGEQCDNYDENKLHEYVDKFGRTRLLKRSEIDKLQREDPEERLPNSNAYANHLNKHKDKDGNQHREFISDVETFQERLKDEIHYQDIQDGEIRMYGVGHYKFSTDATKRSEEMRTLVEMRQQTLRIQKNAKAEKRERKRVARERLVKICHEKGLPIPPEEPESDDEAEADHYKIVDKKDEVIKIQKATLEPTRSGNNSQREWDQGKDSDDYWREAGLPVPPKRSPFFTQQQFIQKQRDERNAEFAPPEIYHQSSSSSSGMVHKEPYRK